MIGRTQPEMELLEAGMKISGSIWGVVEGQNSNYD